MGKICDQIEVPLCIKKGSYYVLPIYYKTCEGVAIPLTGYTAKSHIRNTPDADDDPDIILTTENGGIVISEAEGIIYLIFSQASTLALDDEYEGTWDVFLIPPDTLAYCLTGGEIYIKPSTTKV